MNTVLLSQPEIVARLLEIKAARSAFDVEEAELLTLLKMRIDEGHNEEPELIPDFSMFKDTTRRLLTELWDAPDKMIEKEDVRHDVILDEYASEMAVKNVVRRARRELSESKIKLTIKNVFGKGYQLVPCYNALRTQETADTRP